MLVAVVVYFPLTRSTGALSEPKPPLVSRSSTFTVSSVPPLPCADNVVFAEPPRIVRSLMLAHAQRGDCVRHPGPKHNGSKHDERTAVLAGVMGIQPRVLGHVNKPLVRRTVGTATRDGIPSVDVYSRNLRHRNGVLAVVIASVG